MNSFFCINLSTTVKELLKSDSICESYAEMKGSSFLTHSVGYINPLTRGTSPNAKSQVKLRHSGHGRHLENMIHNSTFLTR